MGKTIHRSFISSLPIMTGYIVLGIGFGILLHAQGYGPIWAFLSSLTIYAGALQYVEVGLIASGASIITTAITAFMVNARHLFYAISMLGTYKEMGRKKLYLAFALTDEVYSVVCNIKETPLPEEIDKGKFCLFFSIFCQSYWITGGLIGNILGSAVNYDFAGIDFSMTAIFVAAFVEQWIAAKNHLSAIIGIVMSLVCLAIFGPANFLIPDMLGIAVALAFCRNKGYIGESVLPEEEEVQNDN